jgi:hypothetical protein
MGRAGGTLIRVRGHPGHASNLITWREDGLTDYILIGEQNPRGAREILHLQLRVGACSR